MILSDDDEKKKLLLSGTIWRRKRKGEWENVYLENVVSKLLREGTSEVDFRTPFGLEHLPRRKFLSSFEFLGFASLRLEELASVKNLIPLKTDYRRNIK